MELSKLRALIDKLAEKTVSNEFQWQRITESDGNFLNQLPAYVHSSIRLFDSYVLSSGHVMPLALISYSNGNHSILLMRENYSEPTDFPIKDADYFRLKSLVENQLINRTNMIESEKVEDKLPEILEFATKLNNDMKEGKVAN